MKKKSALFLTILLCLITMLAGCTSNKSEVRSTSDEVATSKEYLKIKGYDEYMATGNTGYEDISYFNIKNDIPIIVLLCNKMMCNIGVLKKIMLLKLNLK